MLFLRIRHTDTEKNKFHLSENLPAEKPFPFEAALFIGNRAMLVMVVSVHAADAGPGANGFHFEEMESFEISTEIIDALFQDLDYFEGPQSFFRGLARLQIASKMPEIFLQIKEKENLYARFILSDPLEGFFTEKYADWKDWEKIRRESEEQRERINVLIKNRRFAEAKNHFDQLRVVLERLLEKMDLLRYFQKKKVRERVLSVLPGKNTPLLPFELLSENLFFQYRIPGRQNRENKKTDGFTLVYSEDLENSHAEIRNLYNFLKDRHSIELYPEQNYREYKVRLGDSRHFHFAGHGEARNGKGFIIMNGEKLEDLPYAGNLDSVFLNCCHSGSAAEGIISSLIKEGAKGVIASPYEIPDDFSEWDISKKNPVLSYYQFRKTLAPGPAYRLNCLKNPYFGLFYRYFSAFQDKT